MRCSTWQITFQEVPDEISLSFLISGCPLKCSGCHSADSWNEFNGTLLDKDVLTRLFRHYKDKITCVLFLGGEWEENALIEHLMLCETYNFKTALYTGLETVSENILSHLTYLKTGPWIPTLGGLGSKNTNQKMIELKTGRQIYFKQGSI